MRTRDELRELINHGNTIVGHWVYVPVEYTTITIDGYEGKHIKMHAVGISKSGDFYCYGAVGETLTRENIQYTNYYVARLLKGCENPVITEEELKNLFKLK